MRLDHHILFIAGERSDTSGHVCTTITSCTTFSSDRCDLIFYSDNGSFQKAKDLVSVNIQSH